MRTICFFCTVDGAVQEHETTIDDPVKSDGPRGDYECVVSLAPHPRHLVVGVMPFDAVRNALAVAKRFTEGKQVSGLTWHRPKNPD